MTASSGEVADDRAMIVRYARINLVITLVTAWFSYAYFHIDEYFQVLEFVRFRLGQVEAWSLPWEHGAEMRSWAQPLLYWLLGAPLVRLGVEDPFLLARVFRLATGLASWGSLVLFLHATVPWLPSRAARLVHVRVVTLAGFLPYLFVRTSSESASMAALTAGVALVLLGARTPVGSKGRFTLATKARRLVVAGGLLGLAFCFRYQTAFLTAGFGAWVALRTEGSPAVRLRRLALLTTGGAASLALGAVADRWGYGHWTFPAWTYVQANVMEGAAALFGSDPPFAYLWMMPANLFAPQVVLLMLLVLLALWRAPGHPLSWTAAPFLLAHNLIAHKEERFLFPVAIVALGLVTVAVAPEIGRTNRLSAALWERRATLPVRLLVVWNFVVMALLAVWPLGWHHHVRFQHALQQRGLAEVRVYALPDFDLGLPAFHGRRYDVMKLPPDAIARAIDAGGADAWLVTEATGSELHSGSTELDARASLVWSEVPFFDHPALARAIVAATELYDRRRGGPLRPIRYRNLYRLHSPR